MTRGLVLVVLMVVGWACGVLGQEEQPRNWSTLHVGWAFLNISDLNRLLEAQGYPRLPESCFIWGVQSTVLPPGVVGDWSFMISNWQGSTSTQRGDKLSRLTLTWAGGRAEHPLPKSALMRWELQAGLTVGVGGSSLAVLEHRSASFSEALHSPAAAFFTRWFFTVGPQVSARFTLIRLKLKKPVALMLTLSIGYTLTFDNGAWDQEGRALKGPPDNFNSWIVRISVEL